MNKLWTIVLAFLALVIWQIVNPYYTVYQIKQAVEQKDTAKLALYVDFGSLRQNLREQLQYRLHQRFEQQNRSFFGTLTLAATEKTLDQALGHSINPQFVLHCIQGRQILGRELQHVVEWPAQPAPSVIARATATSGTNAPTIWSTRFNGPFQFSLIQQRENSRPVHYVLTRSGLGWQLSNIVLPAEH